MSWHAGDPRNSTHFADNGLFLVATPIESHKPLYMLAFLPLGPMGVGARPVSIPLALNMALVVHEPLTSMAYFPAAKMSVELCPVTAGTDGMYPLSISVRSQPMVSWNCGWS